MITVIDEVRAPLPLTDAVILNAFATNKEPCDDKGAKATSTPCNNMGVKESLQELNKPLEDIFVIKKGSKGKAALIPKPDVSKNQKLALVDWVSFTFSLTHFKYDGFSENDTVVKISSHLESIFGLSVTSRRPNGLNFYESSYEVGINGWGFVCIGGQNDTALITIKGQGLMNSRHGWALRLIPFLEMVEAKISRVDLACDLFESQYKPHDFLESYNDGLFSNCNRSPCVEQRGDWVNETNKGRTLYVGKKESGKLLRIYEKGKQLGGYFATHFSDWVRIELELSSKGRTIPYQVLIHPGQYLAGAYPALSFLYQEQSTVETKKRQTIVNLDKSINTIRHQFGKYIFVISELYGNDKAIEMFTRGKTEFPKGLNPSDYSTVTAQPIQLDPTIKLEEIQL